MQKKITLLLCAAVLAGTATGCKSDGPLFMILGLDKNNKELEMKISEADFSGQFSDVLNTASVSSLNSVTELDASTTNWKLSEVEVGIDLQLGGKIESIVEIGAGSGASLTLSREGQALMNEGANNE